MATVKLEQLSKVYPNGMKAVQNLNLEIADGEFMVLVGPSGCGKTTALRMVAGLEDITSGTLRIGDRIVNDTSPKDRDIAMVFQNYALYPHMTVGENIGFALKLRKMPKAQMDQKIRDAAGILGLTEVLDRKPGQLSGGQRQRVAMGRAIVREPSVFLMDEPLSNLDAKLRVQMRAEVSRVQRQLGVATIYVTHDQIEAMTMGDRVAVMRGGVLQQCDTPQNLYDSPDNLFVAAFIGSPAMNLYEARLDTSGPAPLLHLGQQALSLPAELMASRPGLAGYHDRKVVCGIRPEHLSIATGGEGASNAFACRVELIEALGSELVVHFSLEAQQVVPEGAVEDDALGSAETQRRAGGVARLEPRASVKAGEDIRMAVDTTMIKLFDPDIGLAIRD